MPDPFLDRVWELVGWTTPRALGCALFVSAAVIIALLIATLVRVLL